MKQETRHISSFILYCHPEQAEQIAEKLASFDALEVHAKDDKGKFVLVTEAPHQGVILDRIEALTALDGVIDVSMVYHQMMPADELADEINQQGAAQLMTSKDHLQFCETDSQSSTH